jgi:hypothetical protein
MSAIALEQCDRLLVVLAVVHDLAYFNESDPPDTCAEKFINIQNAVEQTMATFGWPLGAPTNWPDTSESAWETAVRKYWEVHLPQVPS